LKTALAGENVETIKAKTNALAQASMKLGEAMYAANQAGPGPGSGGDAAGGEAKGEDVVDADFEEVDDDQKKKSA
jgi:molecular chaperone DnaK